LFLLSSEQRMTIAEQLYEQAKLLPPPLAREALDFVLFPRARQAREEWRDLVNAQSACSPGCGTMRRMRRGIMFEAGNLVLIPVPSSRT